MLDSKTLTRHIHICDPEGSGPTMDYQAFNRNTLRLTPKGTMSTLSHDSTPLPTRAPKMKQAKDKPAALPAGIPGKSIQVSEQVPASVSENERRGVEGKRHHEAYAPSGMRLFSFSVNMA
jgi:hypothetical protein